MPCKLRTPFTLTFFVMFRHTCFINRSGTYFNSELAAPTLLYTNRSIGPYPASDGEEFDVNVSQHQI
jgi:hypothetical protein